MAPFIDPFNRPERVTRTCRADDCTESFTDSGRFTPERSTASGWFCQRNGWVWCPDHTPEWVAAWRKKKENAR